MTTLYYSNYSDTHLTQQRIVAHYLGLDLKLQKVQKKGFNMALLTPQGLLHDPNSISFYLANDTKLTEEDPVQIYFWLEHFNIQINPLIKQLYGQVFGNLPLDQPKYQYSFDEFNKNLKILDEHLKKRTFFVGNNMTLADIMLGSQLDKAFRLLISQDARKKIPHLTRWFRYVRESQPFVNSIGNIFLCGDNTFTIDFSQPEQKKEEEPANHQKPKEKIQEVANDKEVTKEKQENQVKEQKQNKEEKKQEKVSEKVQEKAEVIEEKAEVFEEKEEKKEVIEKVENENFQDAGGPYTLETFKKQYQNFPDTNEAISNFFKNFSQDWSVWKIYYNKTEDEIKLDFQASNLANGTLLRLEALRKNGFGIMGAYRYKQTKQFEIRGVMVWRGNEIAKEWKEHPSYDFHEFTKLDVTKDADQLVIRQYWMMEDECEGLNIHEAFTLI